jgi:Tol biopolymer transport system component
MGEAKQHEDLIVFIDEVHHDVIIAKSDGKARKIIAHNGTRVRWFSSGDRIVYHTTLSDGKPGQPIVIVDLKGSPIKTIYRDGATVTDVFPDGTQLLVNIKDQSGAEKICAINLRTDSVSDVLTPKMLQDSSGMVIESVSDGSWSMDGGRLLLRVVTESGPAVATIRADRTDFRLLTGFPPSDKLWTGFFAESLSPDGTKALATRTNPIPPNRDQIYVVNTDGSGLRQLTDQRYSRRDPRWSPDGTKIVFSETQIWRELKEITCLMIMDADGKNVHRLFPRPLRWFLPIGGLEIDTSPCWWWPQISMAGAPK